MRLLISIYRWVFKRLPRWFSIPLVIIALTYFIFAFPLLTFHVIPQCTRFVIGLIPSINSISWDKVGIPVEGHIAYDIVLAILTIGLALAGVLMSYWLAGFVYRISPRPTSKIILQTPVLPEITSDADIGKGNPLRMYHRIGIILAGGGAKGAYQAGAMKAIYEFLETHKAHHKVRMIAGTSIGSWNALFWMTGLIKGPPGSQSLHEQWWYQVDVKSVIQPARYIPTRQNYFLSSKPWQEAFNNIFVNHKEISERLDHLIKHSARHTTHFNCDGVPHFYFTRSNVAKGRLEFTTNRNDLSDVPENLPTSKRPRPPVPRGTWKLAQTVDDIRTAVFSSMDLPPLFEYTSIGDSYFEDGGVVDNLPIRFGTEIEKCDLLFILPLNASFDQAVNRRSIVKRLFRVMDIRQGVLERNSFKMIYLFNELCGLRREAKDYERVLNKLYKKLKRAKVEGSRDVETLMHIIENGLSKDQLDHVIGADDEETGDVETAAERGLKRKHGMVQIFSICPAPELIISTAEFWKTQEAAQAFRLMYEQTQYELEKFFIHNRPSPDWVRLARVSPFGEVTYLEDF